jgi:uncharacterized protein YndB with AHSA1/START domain
MIEIVAEVEIDRAPDEVFAFLADMSNNPSWQKGMRECRWTSEPRLRTGSTYDHVARFLGKQIVSSFEVTELDPGHRIRIRTTGGTMPIDVTREVDPIGGGRSMVHAVVTRDPTGVFRLAAPIMRWLVRSSVAADYKRLNALLEEEEEEEKEETTR